jgi:uncharacterized protein YcgL (UPF0745 family)
MSETNENNLHCWVLASDRQPEMYLYLDREEGFDDLPETLRRHFGRPRPVMELDLHPDRRLARVEVAEVMAGLREQGYYLQMPPRIEVELNEAQA